MSIQEEIAALKATLPDTVTLVAVSKMHPAEAVMEAYRAGQRIFGESYALELRGKQAQLPDDIRWHMIGHLQTNKVKYIASFVELIHSVDSERLLEVIEREAAKNDRTIDVLLEVKIAREESKSGWDAAHLTDYLAGGAWKALSHVRIRGLMGVATDTSDAEQVREEFTGLKHLFDRFREVFFDCGFDTLSMGMTHDYSIAIASGSTMVRIGSRIFGARDYSKK